MLQNVPFKKPFCNVLGYFVTLFNNEQSKNTATSVFLIFFTNKKFFLALVCKLLT